MHLVFRLRSEYEGLTGATLVSPPDGVPYDVVKGLKDGGGKIESDDHVFQGALISLVGEHGPVLDVTQVDEEGKESAFVPVEQASSQPGPPPIEPKPLPQAAGPREIPPVAVHPDHESEYATLSKDELHGLIDARELEVKKTATKEELVAALESHDAESVATGQEGVH